MANPGTRRPKEDGWYATLYESYWTERLYTLNVWWTITGQGEERIMMVAPLPDEWEHIPKQKSLVGRQE